MQNHREYCYQYKDSLKKQCNKCLMEKILSDFDIGIKETDGFQYTCKQCNRQWGKKYRINNIEEEKLRHGKYHAENKDIINKKTARWQKDNPDKCRENSRRFYKNNTDSEKERRKKWIESNPNWIKDYMKIYQQQNRPLIANLSKKRRQKLGRAFVTWADKKKIKQIYMECAYISETTGVKHHVDHIVPLSHHLVCGLHNEFNLQILTAKENLLKSNIFVPT
jgi:hypothetical protein